MRTNLSDWGTFVVGSLFPHVVKPAVYHAHDLEECVEGGIPYVVRSKFNNGIKCRVKESGVTEVNPAGVISFGAENSAFFYQKEKWCSGRDIYYIDTRHLSQNTCLFLTSCLQVIATKYEYNFGLFPELLIKEEIKLPVDVSGNPDWHYMGNFIESISGKAKSMLDLLVAITRTTYGEKFDLSSWRSYPLASLFDVKPGARLRKQDMKEGDINYIGASAFNNGITAKIGNTESLHPAGTITVCYNGSIGQAFFQEQPFWATDDVNVLYPRFKLTPGIAKFIIPIIFKISFKYGYIDKWTADRMAVSELVLPAKEDGTPDWDYMESFIGKLTNKAQLIINVLDSCFHI